MRHKLLAMEEVIVDNINVVDANELVQDQAAVEDQVQTLEAEHSKLGQQLEQVDQAEQSIQAIEQTIEPIRLMPEDAQVTRGGSAALASALEHFTVALGVERSTAKRMYAAEGYSNVKGLKLSLEEETKGLFRRIGEAIWKVISRIADWLVTLYQKLTLSIPRLTKRLKAAKHAAVLAEKSDGGMEMRNAGVRNFFRFRGVDIESQDIPAALAKNLGGVQKLWDEAAENARRGVELITHSVEKPQTMFSDLFGGRVDEDGKTPREKREALMALFQNRLVGSVIKSGQFTSKHVVLNGVFMVQNDLHMPFGDYVMRFVLMDGAHTYAPKQYPLQKTSTSFRHEPTTSSAGPRQPLTSLNSRGVDEALYAIEHTLKYLERIEPKMTELQKKLKELTGKARTKLIDAYRGYLVDKKEIESYAIAFGVSNITSKFIHGPISGLPIYLLKSAHYGLNMVEASLKANVSGTRAGVMTPAPQQQANGKQALLTA